MNTSGMNPSEQPSELRVDLQAEFPAWVAQARNLLDDSAQQLDAATLSRLNRARQAALEQRRAHLPRPWFLSAGLASACALLLAVAVWHVRTPAPGVPAAAITTGGGTGFNASDMDMVSGDDSLELYQDLEFYAWLEAQDQDSAG